MFKKISLILFIFIGAVLAVQAQAADEYHDFSVKSIIFNPSKPVVNRAVTVTVNVYYEGTGGIINPDLVKNYSNSFQNFSKSTVVLPDVSQSKPLNSKQTISFVFTGEFTKLGSTKLYFRHSPDASLGEVVVSNNVLEKNVEVVEQYDLKSSSIEFSPLAPAVGQNMVLKVGLSNYGAVNLFDTIGIAIYDFKADGFRLEKTVLPDIDSRHMFEVGETVYYEFHGHFESSGEKNIYFQADSGNRMAESNEDNNIIQKKINVGTNESIDFLVESLETSIGSEELLFGSQFTVTAKVQNNSDFTITNDTGLLLRDYNFVSGGDAVLVFEDFEIISEDYSALPSQDWHWDPGAYVVYTFQGKIKNIGSGLISFSIDQRNKVKEADESNNSAVLPYVVYKNTEELNSFGLLEQRIDFYGATSARAVWKTSRATDGRFLLRDVDTTEFDWFLIKWGLEEWPETEDTIWHQVDLNGLQAGTAYRYQIHNERAGIENTSSVYEFRTPERNELKIETQPQIALDIDAKTATVTWATNLLSDSALYYKLNTAGKYSVLKNQDYSKDHQISLKKLAEGTYQFYAASRLRTGETAESPVSVFSFSQTCGPETCPFDSEPEPELEPEPEEASLPETDPSAVILENDDIPGGSSAQIKDRGLHSRLKGKIVLRVEKNGEAYYISPLSEEYYFLGRPQDAFAVMRQQGVGIKNLDLYRIPAGATSGGTDSDSDGLSDALEEALGLDGGSGDTDNDGFGDKEELLAGYSPWSKKARQELDYGFAKANAGKIFLQVERNGEAWYVSPTDNRRYFLGRPADAFQVMRTLGLGLSEADYTKL